MKNFKLLNMVGSVVLLVAVIFILGSCGGSDSVPAPKASFTYVANEREVTFTNTSTNAETFAWDFGDGQISTDKDPVHTYETYGKYTVKLSVVGKGGTANSLPDELTLAKTSTVVVDGNFSEWSAIETGTSFSVDGNPDLTSITDLKMDYDGSKIYFYVKGTSEMKGYLDIYINADNDTLTGYASGTYLAYGAEYLYEGDLGGDVDASLLKFDGAKITDFSYGTVGAEAGSGFLTNSGAVTLPDGSKAMEFSFSRAVFPNLSAEKIGIAIMDWKDPDNGDWYYIGALPGAYMGKSTFYLYLTK